MARSDDRPFVDRVPTYDELNWPALQSLVALGGSASIAEHLSQVISDYQVPEEVASVPHGDSGRTELEYRLAWARTALRRCGFIENSSRGVWSVTDQGESATEDDLKLAIAALRTEDLARYKAKESTHEDNAASVIGEIDWQDKLLGVLKAMSPDSFERLSQRLLRESGFVKVEVTGRSGDGGIDGKGILQLSLMSFHVLFQCKRYQGSVGPGAVRDFRGAMIGRTDKGLIITTGNFTAEAYREATRDGAPPIDLIDGASLCQKLKEIGLGVSVRRVEEIEINSDWFGQI